MNSKFVDTIMHSQYQTPT